MILDRQTLDLLARCLEYPGTDTASAARWAAERTASDHVEMARALWSLAVSLETASRGEAEERYTALFDLNPVCTLHVGYHLFGDTYRRGALLAGLASELRQAGLRDLGDLPDFLPTVLRLLGRLTDPESREILAEEVLLPALDRMAQALGESESPWRQILQALPALLSEATKEAAPAETSGKEDAAHA